MQPLWITANADINFAQMCLGLVDCSWRIKGEAEGLSKSERGAAPAPEALRNAWIALARQFVKEGLAGNVDQIVGEVSTSRKSRLDLRMTDQISVEHQYCLLALL